MKMKYIAAVCATLGSTGAMAQLALTPANIAAAQTYYISGASAQANAVSAVLPTATFFANPTLVVKITGPGQNDARWGMSNAAVTGGTSKPLLIVYRNSNGSGSGVRQLMAKRAVQNDGLDAAAVAALGAIPTVGPAATSVVADSNVLKLTGCGAISGAPGSFTAACTGTEKRSPDVALSDVNPAQLPGTMPSGPNYFTLDQIAAASTRNAMQGFGIAVNPNAYLALQKQNVADGLLPATCIGSAALPDCQPSIRKADYASLISAEGNIKDSDSLFNSAVAAGEVTVCRRVDTSGTQATSNTFFLNNVCGNIGYQGAYNPLGATDSAPGTLVYNEGSGTGNAKTCLNNAAGYRLGVLSLENTPTGTDTWKFVKIDGVSPNYTAAGGVVQFDSNQRQQFASGAYTYALEMFSAVQPTATPDQLAFASALNTKLGDSTASNLAGIGYFDLPGTWVGNSLANQQTRVTRNNNNCAPLMF